MDPACALVYCLRKDPTHGQSGSGPVAALDPVGAYCCRLLLRRLHLIRQTRQIHRTGSGY